MIQPAQQDYFQATKASGNSGFRMMVFAPYDVQVEEYMVEDAEVIIAAYGISARISKSAVSLLRTEEYK